MARSWAARGASDQDPARGLEDCRRAIRLGRLLRQEDTVVISDLVGLACIQVGVRGVYEIAQRTGDTELALLASVVLGEVAPQRLYTSQRITDVDLGPYLSRQADGSFSLDLPDRVVERVVEMATSCPDRRFAGEGLLAAQVVARYGSGPAGEGARPARSRRRRGGPGQGGAGGLEPGLLTLRSRRSRRSHRTVRLTGGCAGAAGRADAGPPARGSRRPYLAGGAPRSMYSTAS